MNLFIRIVGCIAASLFATLGLICLMSEQMPEGPARISNFALYIACLLGALVFVVLCFVHVLPLIVVYILNQWPVSADTSTALVPFSYEAQQWPVTTVAHL